MSDEIVVAARPLFDKTINLGHILTFVGFVLGGVSVVMALKTDIASISHDTKNLGEKITSIEKTVDKLTEVLVTIGKQEVRIDGIERRMTVIEGGTRVNPNEALPNRRR